MGLSRDAKAGIIVLLFGLAGVILAMIHNGLYDSGVIIDEYVTTSQTITLANIMSITIVIWLLLGVVFAVASR